jgi:heptosyltransferase-2
MKVLVVAPNWIGDALMAQPALRLIARRPEDKIVALAPSWVAPVLRAMPEVDRVLETDLRHGKMQLRARFALAQTVRSMRFEKVFILPNSLKSRLIPWLAGVPKRIGYRGEARGALLTLAPPDPDQSLPMSERYRRLVDPGAPDSGAPRLLVSPQSSIEALAKFAISPSFPIIAICPGAEFGPAKRWPAHHYARLAEQLHAQDETAQLLVLGGSGDRQVAQAIASTSRAPLRVLAGATSLEEVMAIIAVSSSVVSNDSGLMHIAAALGRPQVAIFGSSDPRHTPPASARAQVVWLHLDCSPCFARVCPLGHLNCLNQIEPDQVQAALAQAMAP